jgi:multiple sugar transport system permease protein
MITLGASLEQAARRQRRWRPARDSGVALLLIAPCLAGYVAFFAVPAVRGLYISLTDWDLLTQARFIGLANYATLLKDPDFWNALRVTVYYVLWNIPIQTVFALGIALVMNAASRSNLLRGLILLPWLMPNVVVALLWMWLLDPSLGIINSTIQHFGGRMVPFLSSTELALPSIAGINIWRYVGYTALLIFAGLQTIPDDVNEAALIDGANFAQTFFRITLPLLRPVMAFVLVTSVIGSFQLFDTVAVTTYGGPVNATKVFNYMIYQQAFERFRMGYSTAVSMVLFLLLVGIGVLQMRIMRAGEAD